MNTPILITVLVILLLFSAFFSSTETAFTSLNRTRLKSLADEGSKKARRVLRMSENYDHLISAILVGNNIVNIASASLATILFVENFNMGTDNGTLWSTVVTTVFVLIFGEVCPKALAKERPEKYAMTVAPLLRPIITILMPFSLFFGLIKRGLSHFFKHEDECAITENEILTFVEEAEQEGGIDEQESELIKSAIEFNELNAEDILTPRVDVVALPIDAPADDVEAMFAECGFSRLPIYEDTVDNIIGVLHQKDFYKNPHKPITELMQKPTFIAPNMKIGDLLRLLQEEKTHMAVIADEFGGTLGIVTMEDILEELVGDIWDEHDEVVEEITPLGDNLYRVLGTSELENMFEFFGFEDIESESTTVSGWVVSALEKIPEVGDSFEADNLAVKVIETDSRRVLAIEVSVLEPSKNEEDDTDDK